MAEPVRVSRFSLRAILWIGIGAGIAAGLAAVFGFVLRVRQLGEEGAGIRARNRDAIAAHERRATALREGELAARIEPAAGSLELRTLVHEAARRERQATAELERFLGTGADAVDAAVLRAHGARALAAHERRVQRAIVVGIAVILAIVAAVLAMIGWILRRTAGPLERLAHAAIRGDAFPVPDASPRVREVEALAWALHDLDVAVRDRNEQLAAAHQEAVELSQFGEHVQQLPEETDVVGALAERIHAISGATAVHTLVRDRERDRLVVAQSGTEPAERLRLPILAEPIRCRAVRTLQPVTGTPGAPGTCRCRLTGSGARYRCEPMFAAGEVIGVVNVQAEDPEHLGEVERARIEASVRFAAPALASVRPTGPRPRSATTRRRNVAITMGSKFPSA